MTSSVAGSILGIHPSDQPANSNARYGFHFDQEFFLHQAIYN